MMRRGWYGQSARHSLAARGIRTNSPYLKAKYFDKKTQAKAKRMFEGKKTYPDKIDELRERYYKAGHSEGQVEPYIEDLINEWDAADDPSAKKVVMEKVDVDLQGLLPGAKTSHNYNKKKILITADPHDSDKAYPITRKDAKEVLERQGENVNGIKAIRFTEPKTAEESEAWARYLRGKREIRVFAQPKEEINGNTHSMIKNHVLPHEVGHHVALYKKKITDRDIEMAEARADAHAAGFDVDDSDVPRFRQDTIQGVYAKRKEFDFQDIKGEWVQKSVNKTPPFQRGCENVQAKYTPQKDGTIRVENTCTVDGKKRSIVGKARKVGDRELQVDFFPGIPFTAGEFKVKKYSGDKMTVKGGKYEWQLERKNKKRAYNYTPTYVAGDLPLIAADGVGTAGAATVALIPLAVTAGALYVGGSLIKKQYDSAKNSTKKRKKSTKSRKKSKK